MRLRTEFINNCFQRIGHKLGNIYDDIPSIVVGRGRFFHVKIICQVI